MKLSIIRMVGNTAFGWDGYNKWVDGIPLPASIASSVRESLCYIKTVDIVHANNEWKKVNG